MLRFIINIYLVVFCVLGVSSNSWTQSEIGSISGEVIDLHGALVPNARVTLTGQSSDKGPTIAREAKTDDEGHFSFSGLPFVRYKLRVKTSWIGREFLKEVDLMPNRFASVKIVLSLEPCSDEPETEKNREISYADRAEIVRILISQKIGDSPWASSSEEKVLFTPVNLSPEFLTERQKVRISILTRKAIQEITERKGEQTYYSITKPIRKGNCVSIELLTHLTVKGQVEDANVEDANMAGGADFYEFRKVGGKWIPLLLYATIS